MTNISVGTGPEIQMNGTGGRACENWVSEFEGFQVPAKNQNSGAIPQVSDPAVPPRSCHSAAMQRRTRSRATDSNKVMDNLRAEMKLLHWHKLANEGALKAALLKTKKIKAEGRGNVRQVPVPATLAMPIAERAAWMQQILEEEQSKPVQVTKDFVSKYEAQEKKNEGKMENEVAAHVRCLRDLREKIERREEMKLRRAQYRAAQKQLQGEKKQLLQGKISVCHDHHPRGERAGSAGRSTKESHVGPRKVHGGQAKEGQEIMYSEGALSTVLGSLNKLVELEKRVSSLEKRNVYDSCLRIRSSRTRRQGEIESTTQRTKASVEVPPDGVAAALALGRQNRCAHPSQNAGFTSLHPGSKRGPINFSKQRTEATPQGPSQVYYSVRVMNRGVPGPRHGQRGSRRSRPRQVTRVDPLLSTRPTKSLPGTRKSRESSTFLTQLPDVHRKAWTESGGELRCGINGDDKGCGGCGRFPSSERTKRQRLDAMHRVARGDSQGTRIRQQGHMNQWVQRKNLSKQNQRIPHVSSGMRSSCATGNRKAPRAGASDASLPPSRWSSLHLQEFNNLRAQYSKRTDKLRKDLSRRNQGSGTFMTRGTRTTLTTRPRHIPVASASSHPVRAPNYRNTPDWGRDRRSAVEISRGNTRRVAPSGTRPRRMRGRPGLAIGGKALSITRANSKPSSSTPLAVSTATVTGVFPDRNRQRWQGRWAQRTGGPQPQVGVLGRDCLGGRSATRRALGRRR